MLDKAKTFVDTLDKGSNVAENEVVQNEVDGNVDGKAKRGRELREFEKFINEFDIEASYSNLRKVCDNSNGKAIWVSEQSAKIIEDEGRVGFDEEIERLRVELAANDLELAAKDLENNQLSKEINALRKMGTESRKVSTPNKLREEIEATRE